MAAYGVALIVLVLPTIVLELAVGQLTGRASVQGFRNLSPAFKGLPWLNCKYFPELLSPPCRDAGSMANFTFNAHTKLSTIRAESSLMQFMSALERPSASIADFGDLQYYLVAAHGLVWVVVFSSICFGVRWLGKVIPFMFMAAFSMLLALLIRACTMDGLMPIFNGYLKITDWHKLADYKLWKIAFEQAILATGIGYGAFIAMGSYNRRSNNLVTDSIVIVIGHAIFTVMQFVTVIGLVGFVVIKTGLTPVDVMDKGEAQMWHILTYFSYLPNMKLWSGLLLFACICILFNIFCLLSMSVLSALEDALGDRWSHCCLRFLLALFVCSLIFSLSLYFTTQAGRHAYELVTGFLKYITIYVILTFELFATAWFYCAHRLGMDLHVMLRNACCWCFGHFLLLFTYLLPVIPAGIAILNLHGYDFSTFSSAIHSWPWSEWVGAAIAIIPLLPIPLCLIFTVINACCCRRKQGLSKGQRLRSAFATQIRQVHREKSSKPPRYTGTAPGYLLLPQAPLAEPETYA
ncbi:Sodium:neurotransmitter symporter family protein [Dictyocaulus viviparus]|uniref:Sodium:neurotransmitter symporter family protein n=1 Tax=Dictyocaulus viviparus TaxID=29172 RepID=A0A0D8Y2G1_DICVI|nr:Sodium:neurotransmitter symporter family protein [Dictyocaulus viviparus]